MNVNLNSALDMGFNSSLFYNSKISITLAWIQELIGMGRLDILEAHAGSASCDKDANIPSDIDSTCHYT